MADRVRRLTGDRTDPVTTPVTFDRVRVARLSRGDRILVRPDEPVPRDGTVVAVLGPAASRERPECAVETTAGERERRRIEDEIERNEVVREAWVVVEVDGRLGLPWWLSASAAGLALRSLWSEPVRWTLVVLVLLVAFGGTGLGGFNPVERVMQESGVADDIAPSTGPVGPIERPPEPPSVTVTPPEPTATGAGTGPATATATRTTSPTARDDDRAPVGDDPDAPPPTATVTTATTGTPTSTPTPSPTSQPPDETPPGADASIDVTAADPPLFRSVDGQLGRVNGTVGGTLSWTTDRVDRVVLILQVWVPGHGWAETRRVTHAPAGSNASLDSPVALRTALGTPVVYANASRSDAFENPVSNTTRVTPGRAAVTAVLFDGETEVARVTDDDGFNVTVRNIAFDLALSEGNESGDTGGNVTLTTGNNVAPGDEWVTRGNLTNAGTVAGEVSLTELRLVPYENGRTDPEAEVDDTGGDPGRGAGELQDALQVRVAVVEPNGTREYVFGNATDYRSLTGLANETVPIAELRPDETATLVVEYRVDPEAGNEIQSDSVVIGFGFTMVEIS